MICPRSKSERNMKASTVQVGVFFFGKDEYGRNQAKTGAAQATQESDLD